MNNYVIWLNELGIGDIDHVGGKNASLGEMIQNLTNLMPGLGVSAFWQYLSVPVSGVLILIALSEIAMTRKPDTPVEGAPR